MAEAFGGLGCGATDRNVEEVVDMVVGGNKNSGIKEEYKKLHTWQLWDFFYFFLEPRIRISKRKTLM